MTFDPSRRLVMASFRTVLGHGLNSGEPLTIVEEPTAKGEIDEAMARRLWAGRIAVYAEDHRPTPVETPEQEKARLAVEALRDGEEAVMQDLIIWQADDAETGKKAGAKVTKDDLLVIARRETVAVEGDDNKPDLIRKITEQRAQASLGNATYSGTAETVDAGQDAGTGATGAGTGKGADTGAFGDTHGSAGEGGAD